MTTHQMTGLNDEWTLCRARQVLTDELTGRAVYVYRRETADKEIFDL